MRAPRNSRPPFRGVVLPENPSAEPAAYLASVDSAAYIKFPGVD
jgi:hypothetical protein